MTRATLAAGLIVCMATMAGCASGEDNGGGDAREGGSVVIGLPTAPDSLDPAIARSPEALRVVWMTNTPALTYARAQGSAGTKVIPGLAQRMPTVSEDGLTYTFRVRRNLRYSNGRPVRAQDFERGVKRAVRLNPAARRLFAGIEGMSADSRRREVRIDLRQPDPAFPYVLASTWAAPAPRGVPLARHARVPGVGPYVLGRTPRGSAFLLNRRRDLRLPGVPGGNVDVVSGRVVSGAAARTRATLDGDLDAVQGEPPVPRLPEIRSKYKDRYSEHTTLTSQFARFDLTRPPFSARRVRRAVSFALDERIIARLEEGFMEPSCTLLPPSVVGHNREAKCPYGERQGNADLLQAQRLVEASPDPHARVLVDPGSGSRADVVARYYAATLTKIGLRARVARTARQRRRAQTGFTSLTPGVPNPYRYLTSVREPGIGADAGRLAQEGPPAKNAEGWAALDAQTVQSALVAPFGTTTAGTLLSERLDAQNCLRFHPVYGLDLSSLCLR